MLASNVALPDEHITKIRTRIERAARPLIFFDDDADGLASYLLTYSLNPEAVALRAAMGPELGTAFIKYVQEHQPDLIVVLDKPRADKEFFEEVQTPTIWLDHHDPHTQAPHEWPFGHLDYYNPALHDENDHRPVAYWMRRVTQGPLWLAAVGTTSDWDDSLLADFREAHPQVAPKANDIHEALFESPLGEIIRIFNFSLKGRTSDINKNIRALTKIRDPQELLQASSAAAKHVRKHTKPLLEEYRRQLAQALGAEVKNGLLVHVFTDIEQSFVADVANELLVRSDADVIVVARSDAERTNLSMRSHDVELPPVIEYALEGVDGYGGGHSNACGGSIVSRDWEEFVKRIRERL